MPRSRFAPVKTTGDLLALRSDAYQVGADGSVLLVSGREGQPPRPATEPRGSEGSSNSGETATDPFEHDGVTPFHLALSDSVVQGERY